MARITAIDLTTELRFDRTTARAAVLALQTYMPPGTAKLDVAGFGRLVLAGDDDAIVIALWQGLAWQDKRLRQQDINDMLDEAYRRGAIEKNADFSVPIVEALERAGLVELIRKERDEEGRPDTEHRRRDLTDRDAADGRPRLASATGP